MRRISVRITKLRPTLFLFVEVNGRERKSLTLLICLCLFINIHISLCMSFRRGDNMGSRYLLLTTRLYSISFGHHCFLLCGGKSWLTLLICLYPLTNILIALCLSLRREGNMRSHSLLLTTRLYSISFGKCEEDSKVIVFLWWR